MLPQNPQQAFGVRMVVLWTLRAAGVVLAAVGLFLVVKRVSFAVMSGMGFMSMLSTWDGTGEDHSLYRGLALIAVGVVLALLSVALARWIVPAWRSECPSCGYEPAKTHDPSRCPECGLDGAFPAAPRPKDGGDDA